MGSIKSVYNFQNYYNCKDRIFKYIKYLYIYIIYE